ncbi:acyl-CoA thioesterase [Actinomadura rugatobispora]|uniref:Acyl-CoA thioesterase n=1 Tax=Actinomadura rugatobispora TaxID=1994 RepID=A0ABW0ZM94_9ACTN|nr:acyl-CoA thioesterase II [Actinomadura rugatobispora]
MLTDIGNPLGPAILASLDGILAALRLRPAGDDRFRVPSEPGRLQDRVFGGQLLAQALLAADATVSGKAPHSLHAAFVEAGAPGRTVDLAVERVRDGRSVSTRRVTVLQEDRPRLVAIVSFHAGATEPDVHAAPPDVPRPEELPLLQHWAQALPAEQREAGRSWIDRPPPLEMRIGEAPTFLGGASADGPRSHWMRLPRDIGDDRALHSALLAYASDFLLMDMAFRSHPGGTGVGRLTGYSLDHALWLHRPVHFDRWHLHTQETIALTGDRGLTRGAIHDSDGRLVASVTQEVLVRPLTAR